MELFETKEHYILQNDSYSLWCSRENGNLEARKGHDLLNALNHVCLGKIYGFVGKVIVHQELEPRLILVRQQEEVGELPGCGNVFRITRVVLLPLNSEPPKNLEIQTCPKHHFGGVTNSDIRESAALAGQGGIQRTFQSILTAASSVKASKMPAFKMPSGLGELVNPLTPDQKELKEKERFERKITEEIHKLFADGTLYYCPGGDITSCTQRQQRCAKAASKIPTPSAQQPSGTGQQAMNSQGTLGNYMSPKDQSKLGSEHTHVSNNQKSSTPIANHSTQLPSQAMPVTSQPVSNQNSCLLDVSDLLGTTTASGLEKSTSQSSVDVAQQAPNGKTHWRQACDDFFWNRHMLQDLINSQSPLADPWVVPVIQGYVQIEACTLTFADQYSGQYDMRGDEKIYQNIHYKMALVSRRSRHRAGTRYKRRGVDEDGHCANYVETEQILEFSNHVVSFVQTRGSVPLYWSQTGIKYKPPPRIEKDDAQNHVAFSTHLDTQLRAYDQVTLVSLLDLTGKETVVGDAFLRHTARYNNPAVTYVAFDFHEYCRGMKFENVSVLTESILQEIKQMRYCWADRNGLICEQRGVFRVNCLDCLDRTNVVQSAIARLALEIQSRKLGLLPPDEELPRSARLIFQQMWANNGDAISRQYAGTAALKGDFTRTGQRRLAGMMKDGVNSANRYYINKVKDAYKQTALDLLQGTWRPDPATLRGVVKEASDEEGEASLVEKEQNLKVLIDDCRRMLVTEPEQCLGGWGLIDCDQDTGDPTQQDMDTIVLVSQRACYIASYDNDVDRVTSSQKINLEDLERFEIGPGPTGAAGGKERPLCVRIHYTHRDEPGYFYTMRGTGVRLFNNIVIHIRTLDEAKESMRAIYESFAAARQIMSQSLPLNERIIHRKRSKPHPGVVNIAEQAQEKADVLPKQARLQQVSSQPRMLDSPNTSPAHTPSSGNSGADLGGILVDVGAESSTEGRGVGVKASGVAADSNTTVGGGGTVVLRRSKNNPAIVTARTVALPANPGSGTTGTQVRQPNQASGGGANGLGTQKAAVDVKTVGQARSKEVEGEQGGSREGQGRSLASVAKAGAQSLSRQLFRQLKPSVQVPGTPSTRASGETEPISAPTVRYNRDVNSATIPAPAQTTVTPAAKPNDIQAVKNEAPLIDFGVDTEPEKPTETTSQPSADLVDLDFGIAFGTGSSNISRESSASKLQDMVADTGKTQDKPVEEGILIDFGFSEEQKPAIKSQFSLDSSQSRHSKADTSNVKRSHVAKHSDGHLVSCGPISLYHSQKSIAPLPKLSTPNVREVLTKQSHRTTPMFFIEADGSNSPTGIKPATSDEWVHVVFGESGATVGGGADASTHAQRSHGLRGSVSESTLSSQLANLLSPLTSAISGSNISSGTGKTSGVGGGVAKEPRDPTAEFASRRERLAATTGSGSESPQSRRRAALAVANRNMALAKDLFKGSKSKVILL